MLRYFLQERFHLRQLSTCLKCQNLQFHQRIQWTKLPCKNLKRKWKNLKKRWKNFSLI
uniref:hypothetical protein n=1 Tax=Flavobacterium cutihirudinis TaxID=1265740 RepID=UPI0037421C82